MALSGAELRRVRARAQFVGGGERARSVAGVVERVFALQAQDAGAAALGLRARARGLTPAGVRRALETERSVVRGWFMRGTLHLVPAADARWLLALYGERLIAGTAARYRALGLDEALTGRALALIAAEVADGPRTRAELGERLASLGVDTTGQAPIHLIRRAALTGLVCEGPRKDGESAYVAAGDWLPSGPGPVGEAAVAELAVRHRRAYAPAEPEDFAAWSGLPLGAARTAWASLRPARTAAPGAAAAPDVRLLPAYDGYWLGHRDRSWSVPAGRARDLAPGGGQIRAAVVADGLLVGTWGRTRRDGVRPALFDGVSDAVAAGAAAEAAAVESFAE
ncbi:crosslink repair DNA glycosylase YcaQ family protein [Streptomyces sp. NPDC051940]|uniref:DNA glycosylase AlkZ-like family protein n=1 Tax=Streptomyces sp. NPDC051940 TaxID=3155675 RepID=UPI00341CE33C